MTDITFIGWFVSSVETAAVLTLVASVIVIIFITIGIVFLHRQIERRIERVGEL